MTEGNPFFLFFKYLVINQLCRKGSWCTAERNTCPKICGGIASSNTCDPVCIDSPSVDYVHNSNPYSNPSPSTAFAAMAPLPTLNRTCKQFLTLSVRGPMVNASPATLMT